MGIREEKLRIKAKEMSRMEEGLYTAVALYIGGVDEVGRGPLAGPVTAACVVLPRDWDVLGIDDSKKLSPKKRLELAEIIKEKALSWAICSEDEKTIDQINILEATKRAMRKAAAEADMKLRKALEKTDGETEVTPEGGYLIDHLLIDGVQLDMGDMKVTGVVKGDQKSVSVAAASIIAKVARDGLMEEYDVMYPGYDFASNKGYGTKAHYEGLKELGPCPVHRMTFLRKFNEGQAGDRKR